MIQRFVVVLASRILGVRWALHAERVRIPSDRSSVDETPETKSGDRSTQQHAPCKLTIKSSAYHCGLGQSLSHLASNFAAEALPVKRLRLRFFEQFNIPDRTRTCYLSFRKAALYPDELRGRVSYSIENQRVSASSGCGSSS